MDRVAGSGRGAVSDDAWIVVGVAALFLALVGAPGMAVVVVLGAWAWSALDRRSGKERRVRRRRRG